MQQCRQADCINVIKPDRKYGDYTMKRLSTKLLTLGLTAIILTGCLTACKVNKHVNINADVKVNGEEVFSTKISTDSWEIPQINKVSVEHKKYFEEAVSELDGYFYEPVALLGTQLVSGTNYCFLCKPTVVAKNAAGYVVLTYIYVDLQGKATYLKDKKLALPGTETANDDGTPMVGGWSYSDSAVITDDIKNIVYKAVEAKGGAAYEPIAYIGSQVVAGTNHAILCKTIPSVSGQDAAASLILVYVYEDLEGNCEITDTEEIKLEI